MQMLQLTIADVSMIDASADCKANSLSVDKPVSDEVQVSVAEAANAKLTAQISFQMHVEA